MSNETEGVIIVLAPVVFLFLYFAAYWIMDQKTENRARKLRGEKPLKWYEPPPIHWPPY